MKRGLSTEQGILAIAVAKSNNAKIGDCATTYAAQASCPSSCVFFNGGGCYAENGRLYTGVTKPLNEAAEYSHADPHTVALEEAAAIDALYGSTIEGRPMRLHTVGDCRTDEAARIVAAAAERYMDRGGGTVWTYTHAWRLVDRESWGRVSVLASCETAEQVELARARGYATSLVVDGFRDASRYSHSGADIVPCPAQTRDDVTCSSCRLCMNDTGLRARGYSIGFEIHGTASTVHQARRALARPSDPSRRLTSRDIALEYLERQGYWPFPAELARLSGITPSSARDMLERLRAEGADAILRAGGVMTT